MVCSTYLAETGRQESGSWTNLPETERPRSSYPQPVGFCSTHRRERQGGMRSLVILGRVSARGRDKSVARLQHQTQLPAGHARIVHAAVEPYFAFCGAREGGGISGFWRLSSGLVPHAMLQFTGNPSPCVRACMRTGLEPTPSDKGPSCDAINLLFPPCHALPVLPSHGLPSTGIRGPTQYGVHKSFISPVANHSRETPECATRSREWAYDRRHLT